MKNYPKSKLNHVKRGANRAVYDVEQINTILDAGYIGYVSYAYEGQAITLPMAYAREGSKIILHSAYGNRMMKYLLEAGKMSMTVMHLDGLVLAKSGLHHSVNYRSVVVYGAPEVIQDREEKVRLLAVYMEHFMKGRWEVLRPINEKEIKRTMVITMDIETASAKVRNVGVNDEPEDEDIPVWAGVVPLRSVLDEPITASHTPEGVDVPEHVRRHIKAYNEKGAEEVII